MVGAVGAIIKRLFVMLAQALVERGSAPRLFPP